MSIVNNYINYGKCKICHKKKNRIVRTNICVDCFEDLAWELGIGREEKP